MPSTELSQQDRDVLLKVARAGVEYWLEHTAPLPVRLAEYSDALREHRASFVTLTTGGRLRGCIGSLKSYRSLVEDVASNAGSACGLDRRFTPLSAEEYPQVHIEVSVLSKSQVIEFRDESDLLTQLRPGVDGLIIESGDKRATFLPTVWETLPTPAQFLLELKRKAGISAAEESELAAWRYTAEVFEEPRPP